MARYKVTTESGTYAVETEDKKPVSFGGAAKADAATLPVPGGTPISMIPPVGNNAVFEVGRGSSETPNVGAEETISTPLSRKVSQFATTPIRGGRGVGVGAQRLISGDSPGFALERAAAAVKPGFVPQEGERIGSFLGEMAVTAPMFAATGGGGALAQAAKAGLTSGTITAIQDASERGDVEIGDVVFSSVLGAALPIVKPTTQFIARMIKGGTRVSSTMGTTVVQESAEELLNEPALLRKYKGTAEAVGEKVADIQRALIRQHEKVAEYLDRVRRNIGFREPFTESVERVGREGFQPKSAEDIVREFQHLRKGKIPVDAVRGARVVKAPEKSIMGAIPKQSTKKIPGRTTETEFQIPDKLRLRELYRLREAVDDHLSFSGGGDVPKIRRADQHFFREMRRQINEIVEDIPGGKTLRAADTAYHQSRQLYDDLQKKLATQGKAEDVIRGILRGGDIDQVLGVKGDSLRLLQRLEKKVGKKLVDPARKELAAKNIREIKATGGGLLTMPAGFIYEGLGPKGMARVLNTGGAVSKFLNSLGEISGKRKVLSPLQSLLLLRNRNYSHAGGAL